MISPRLASYRLATSAALLTALVALSGCDRFHQTNLEGVSPAQQAACRTRTEELYTTQNRGELYRSDSYAASNSATPFSGVNNGNAASDQLGARFAYQRMLNDCYNTSPDPVPGSAPAAKP